MRRFGPAGCRGGRNHNSCPPPEGRTLYRARDGKIMGVCKGLAEYFEVEPVWIRLFTILGALATGIWPALGIYILAGLLMKPKPVMPVRDIHEGEFYSSYVSSRKAALARLKEQFARLDRRIRRMEDAVTSRDFDWQRRFDDRR
ncbi:envelope stress response membrane protein PspC [Oleidesulfovibrio alaskensis]|uniref:envelope stress response membrane protein PspC n=1 Tax=Oleidesulfovibrio alaskensis TaxID=58180 RepID=UPI0003FFA7D1|nr:envelope stress response membrane protein PspC [Oleidesulfovibrio alaskensis]